ncbi:hypothetical protein LI90_3791 [Carbonactinospora thermoautotrophica]|uniref:N-acetyltransferase domain-containing protein n=1 Tax=Carbonactinospora thermoautotrophica TaxID=1469144 RepID=A0A132MXW0_9ACTN|nr:GNAT family N-acetyltransferase [Carbonactinospora thermoautotrophica]KWX02745.1 hypothetical protein LI90_3791 [Carbonactinospora thermoautotrophica]
MSMSTYVLRRAEADEISVVQDLLREAARWLHQRGYDQWDQAPQRFSAQRLRPYVERGEVWLLWDADRAVATITVEFEGDPEFWTPDELAEPAAYVAKLAVTRSHAGQELGARMLAWARDYAARQGAKWVRLDAWKTNPDLHAYYRDRGWQHVRTVDLAHRRSGALFQLPAERAQIDGIVEYHPKPRRLGVLRTRPSVPASDRSALYADTAGNWRPSHQHITEGGAPWVVHRWLGRPVEVGWLPDYRYRIAADATGQWALYVREGGRWHREGPVLTEPGEHEDLLQDHRTGHPAQGPWLTNNGTATRWTLKRGHEYVLKHAPGENNAEAPLRACRMVVYELAAPTP